MVLFLHSWMFSHATVICSAKTILPAKANPGLNWNCKRWSVNPQIIN